MGAVGEVLLQFIQDQDHLSWGLPATDGIKELYCHSGPRNGCYGTGGEGVGGREGKGGRREQRKGDGRGVTMSREGTRQREKRIGAKNSNERR